MLKKRILFASLGLLLAAGAITLAVHLARRRPASASTLQTRLLRLAEPSAKPDSEPLLEALRENLAGYRKIIVLLAEEKDLKPEEREPINHTGFAIYYENQGRLALLDQALAAVAASAHKTRFAVLEEVLDWIESGNGLYDADRLAFKENLRTLQGALAADPSLPAVQLHKRVPEDPGAPADLQTLYHK